MGYSSSGESCVMIQDYTLKFPFGGRVIVYIHLGYLQHGRGVYEVGTSTSGLGQCTWGLATYRSYTRETGDRLCAMDGVASGCRLGGSWDILS